MSKTILIVEDTPDLLQNLVECLNLEGYTVVSTSNAKEALVKLQHLLPDLIITDLMMYDMDGFSFIEEVKKDNRLKNVPVSIFSAKPFKEYKEKAEALGVIGCIQKPSPLQEILDSIDKFITH